MSPFKGYIKIQSKKGVVDFRSACHQPTATTSVQSKYKKRLLNDEKYIFENKTKN